MDRIDMTKRYCIAVLKHWVFWCSLALDLVGLVLSTVVQGFEPPKWLYWAILSVGFLVANVQLYGESKKRIDGLVADKVTALKGCMQELIMNSDFAIHNASVSGSASSPGGLVFIPLQSEICHGVFLAGDFSFPDNSLAAVREYLETVAHLNRLIVSVDVATGQFQSASGNVPAIRRYCSGEMDAQLDKHAKGAPQVIDNLKKLIDNELQTAGGGESPGSD